MNKNNWMFWLSLFMGILSNILWPIDWIGVFGILLGVFGIIKFQ